MLLNYGRGRNINQAAASLPLLKLNPGEGFRAGERGESIRLRYQERSHQLPAGWQTASFGLNFQNPQHACGP